MATDAPTGRGHAIRPHTADAIIEAWGPTPAACYEEAVGAFVELFADVRHPTGGAPTPVDVGPGPPEELLVLLLEAVLVEAEGRGRVPARCQLAVEGDRVVGTFTSVPVDELEVIGPVPKGIAYHDLAFAPTGSGWHCRATVDV